QAELFAAIREYFEIPKQENLSLKDYPTIRHCVKFVLDNKSVSQTQAKHSQKETINKYLESGSSHSKETYASASATAVAEPEINIDEIKKAVENNHPPRHFRHTPVICEMPVKEEIIKKFDPARPVLIIGENLELIKSCRKELTKLELSSVVLTSQKTKLSETWTVDFAQEESAENALKEIALKYPDIQGIIYLMGCADKPFVNSLDPMKDMRYYALPLFSAIKLFNKALNNPSQGCSCFVASATTCDGRFGYSQNASYDPVYASIYGISLCMRKELDKAVVKLIDFEKDAPISLITRKIFYEVQYSDLRHTICYHSNKRHSMIAIPAGINKTKEKYPLKGKKVIITGGGRGLGALFAKIIASRWQPEIIIMDIIEENPFAEKLLSMTAQEAENYKKTEFLASLKGKNSKVTPAILEKEFTKLKDAAGLIKTLKELSALGSKVSYLRCDLNNAAQFEETVLKLKEKSRADGLVHFAGLERSKLIADKEKEEFELIFKTKAQSAINLWKADIVKDNGFWVMISSIAGKFGNLGQSDYAAASDYISKFAINLYNKGQKAFSIDMTGIANIGMGARPGVEAFLKSQNMEFLYPEEVMNALADEIVYGDLPELIYSGDLGKLDWDKQLQYEPSYGETKEKENTGLHFASKGKISKDSFSFEKNISVQSDPYMEDHAINGTPVFPGVMGIESFAQAINAYLSVKPLNLKNISFQLPIKLLKNNPADIRIKGEGKDNIQMKIESDFINSKGIKMGETRIHFKAEYDSSVSPTQSAPEHIKIKNKYKTEKETIYKTYFHGPSFQVLDGIISASDKEVLGVFKKPNTPLLKDKEMNYIFHPMIIEAVFQTCGWRDLYLENKMTLPDKIAQVSILDNNPDPEKLYTLAVYKGTDDYGKSIYDGWAFDENGKVFVFLKDYVMIPVKI
ncbi:MAG: SDR family NAD(P)-dependent oxidoreductase, partial [Elusimicrobia bacterium]|nr:SDR family NAD(P)-dependent oxidoreductase [Elusimicrobiota bacterium]